MLPGILILPLVYVLDTRHFFLVKKQALSKNKHNLEKYRQVQLLDTCLFGVFLVV